MAKQRTKASTERKVEQAPEIHASIQSTPRILLEILVYGYDRDKEEIHHFMQDLLKQINKEKAADKVRLFFRLTDGETTEEEQKQWLVKNCSCKYYQFANPSFFKLQPRHDFVKTSLAIISDLERTVAKMKLCGITVSRAQQ
jgi:hypothetical protein